MKRIVLIFTLMIAMLLNSNATSFTKSDVLGCWLTEDTNTILELSSDGTFLLTYIPHNSNGAIEHLRKVEVRGTWEISNRFIILNRDFPVYSALEGRSIGDFDVKKVKVCDKHKLLWGYSIKSIHMGYSKMRFRKGHKIYMFKDVCQ